MYRRTYGDHLLFYERSNKRDSVTKMNDNTVNNNDTARIQCRCMIRMKYIYNLG